MRFGLLRIAYGQYVVRGGQGAYVGVVHGGHNTTDRSPFLRGRHVRPGEVITRAATDGREKVHLLRIDDDRLETLEAEMSAGGGSGGRKGGAYLEGVYGDVAGVGVELLLRALVVIAFPCTHTTKDQDQPSNIPANLPGPGAKE